MIKHLLLRFLVVALAATTLVAQETRLSNVAVRTAAGGVLDSAWLRRTLALPSGAALMELDLDRLRRLNAATA